MLYSQPPPVPPPVLPRRYKRHIVPLLSLSVDFYIRVFVRVFTNATAVKDASTRLAYVWQSSGCDSFYLQRVGQKKINGNSVKHMPNHGPAVPEMRCPETGSGYIMGGPIWAEPIHDHEFVKGLMADIERDKSRCGLGGGCRRCWFSLHFTECCCGLDGVLADTGQRHGWCICFC